jgi:hypothetical protein
MFELLFRAALVGPIQGPIGIGQGLPVAARRWAILSSGTLATLGRSPACRAKRRRQHQDHHLRLH